MNKYIVKCQDCKKEHFRKNKKKFSCGSCKRGGVAYGKLWKRISATVKKDIGVCAICGLKEHLEVHHLDENKQNNDRDNLQVRCDHCHHTLHRIKDKNAKIVSFYIGKHGSRLSFDRGFYFENNKKPKARRLPITHFITR